MMSPLLLFSLNCSRSAYFLQHSPEKSFPIVQFVLAFGAIPLTLPQTNSDETLR
jgi:hypothetical protein